MGTCFSFRFRNRNKLLDNFMEDEERYYKNTLDLFKEYDDLVSETYSDIIKDDENILYQGDQGYPI